MTSSRDSVARELSALLRGWSLDDPWSDKPGTSTRTLYATDELYEVARVRLHESLVEQSRAASPIPPAEGRLAVVVTAGPPGAGKSTALAEEAELVAFRSIDADDFKDDLLAHADADGLLDAWTARTLGDDLPVSLRELSGFVHAESTEVAAAMRRACFADGENVIVHGTLSSVDHTAELLEELDSYGYDRLVVFDVEAPADIAVDRALDRWWRVRSDRSDPLGGRFVAPAAIRAYYRSGKPTVTSENARRLHDFARDLGWESELRLIETE
ncbi:zeta toxin family protein [Leifsonia sp. ZF2019]|uniref:zeta toxin family protein n=1 Tax=Leifsonia sp. ZF2019 TaxID=2781978 RepID=UPI001CC0E0BB|nr:zeta toxin family protein [Leifsonia sp. ZF2019]UAJ78989.1 zeta toxin family protein [Leifsonia sp. ZF2019]